MTLKVWIQILLAHAFLVVACEAQASYEGILQSGQEMLPEDVLASSSTYLKLQTDGNVVLYRKNPPGTVLWSTNTAGKCLQKLKLQADGNLVLTSCDNAVLWSSGTSNVASAVL